MNHRIGILLALMGMALLSGGNGGRLSAQAPEHSPDIDVQIYGSLQNGTTGQPVRVDRLELIRIDEREGGERAMQSLQVLEPAGPVFQFRPVDRRGAPLLIRATRLGDATVQIVPLSPESVRQGKAPLSVPVHITVFDRGATPDDVEIHSGLQVSRVKDGLDITLVYAIANHSRPPRSFAPGDLIIPVPADARDLNLTLTSRESGMPVTLKPIPVPGGVGFDHPILPGASELLARFRIDGYTYHDRIDFAKETERKAAGEKPAGEKAGPTFARVLIWRPPDAKPDVEGGTIHEFNIPDLGHALQVTYERDEVIYHFRNGGIWYENPMDSHSNPIFDNPWKTAVGLLAGLTILLLIVSILAGIQGRQERKS